MATIESRGGQGGFASPTAPIASGGTFEMQGADAQPGQGDAYGVGGGGGGAGADGGTGLADVNNSNGRATGGTHGSDGSFIASQTGSQGFDGGSNGNAGGGGGGGGNGFVYGGTGELPLFQAFGGTGGKGGNASGFVASSGGGGSGGFGAAFTAAAQVTAYAPVMGGTGGAGGAASDSGAAAGNGGDGGGDVYVGANAAGASLTVDSGVRLAGGTGGAGGVATGSFLNRTGIAGTGGAGVVMIAQGSITNGGTLQGGNGGAPVGRLGGSGGVGVAFNGGSDANFNSLINTGTIQGGNANNNSSLSQPGGAGVVGGNLVVDNSAAGASIAGGFNNVGGTGTQADAITYLGGTNNLLLLGAGTLSGGIGISGALAVANNGTTGSVSLANVAHDGPNGAGSLTLFSLFGGGTDLTLSGANTYSGGTTITAGSTLTLNGPATYTSKGTLQSAAAGTGAIAFTNGTATGRLVLPLTAQPTAAHTTFSNAITGFSTGSQLDLAGLTGAMVSYSSTNSLLTVTGTSGGISVTDSYKITLADPTLASDFTSRDDGTGNGTLITLCFAGGTRIRTSGGEVAVEALRVGDKAVTASGELRTITWIGRRHLDGAGGVLPHDRQPVRVRRGAFGPGLPARELRLSPGHPVLVDADEDGAGGVLVPVMCLINGTSIAREAVERVTYWHIELDAHDILLAEGLPAESYYDMGSRAWFAGADGRLVDPDLVPTSAHGRCRPVAVDGALVDAERLRLDAVFAAELSAHSAWSEGDSFWIAA